jgi:hypothetical protein
MFDHLSGDVKNKLRSFDESGMGYWIVKVRLEDGSMYSNVTITDSFKFGFPTLMPFRLREIKDVWWEGYRGSMRSGEVVPIVTHDD